MRKIWDLLLIRKIWAASVCGQIFLGAVAKTKCFTLSVTGAAQQFVRQSVGSRHIPLLRETIISDVFVRRSFQSMILTVSKSLMNLVLSQLQNHPLNLVLSQLQNHPLSLSLLRTQSQHLTQSLLRTQSQHLTQSLLRTQSQHLTQSLLRTQSQHLTQSLLRTQSQHLTLPLNQSLSLILNLNHLQSLSPSLHPSQSLLLSHSLIQVLNPSLIITLSKRSQPCSKRSRKSHTMITSTHGPRGRLMRSSITSKSSSS